MSRRLLTTDTVELLSQAADWRLIALLFECPALGWHAELKAVAGESPDAQLKVAAESAQTEASEGLYHTTFGPGGPAAPREVSHRDAIQPGAFLSELKAYYEAFTYRSDSHEPPDHIAVEADFVGYLRLKEAYARCRAEDDESQLARRAAEKFIIEHVSVVAGPLAQSLQHSGIQYLTIAASALLARSHLRPEDRSCPSEVSQPLNTAL